MDKTRRINKKYSAEFKLSVILDMRTNRLSYHETVRKYDLGNDKTGGARLMLQRWERIYLEEGADGFMVERRGRSGKNGRLRKELKPDIVEDLIAENQRLRMENEYLKKLDALVRKEERENGKKRK